MSATLELTHIIVNGQQLGVGDLVKFKTEYQRGIGRITKLARNGIEVVTTKVYSKWGDECVAGYTVTVMRVSLV